MLRSRRPESIVRHVGPNRRQREQRLRRACRAHLGGRVQRRPAVLAGALVEPGVGVVEVRQQESDEVDLVPRGNLWSVVSPKASRPHGSQPPPASAAATWAESPGYSTALDKLSTRASRRRVWV